jgi:hypothetical protein
VAGEGDGEAVAVLAEGAAALVVAEAEALAGGEHQGDGRVRGLTRQFEDRGKRLEAKTSNLRPLTRSSESG